MGGTTTNYGRFRCVTCVTSGEFRSALAMVEFREATVYVTF